MTIQFPPWISGESHGGGISPIAIAGPPKHIAVPIPRVSVGVTKIRNILSGSCVPSIPHAPGIFVVQVVVSHIGDGGQTAGIGKHHHGP